MAKTPPLGSHIDVWYAARAFKKAAERTCQVFQLFTSSPQSFGRRLRKDEIAAWFEAWDEYPEVEPAAAHWNYVSNLATPNPARRRREIEALKGECRRCRELQIPMIVVHPGSHGGAGPEAGMARVAAALNDVLRETTTWDYTPLLLLETTSGHGTALGGTFEELATMIDRCVYPEHVGVCLDTCHVFAAGYDIRTVAGFRRTFQEFDRWLGMDALQLVHLNDSAGKRGSHLDRHRPIGDGEIGLTPFRMLMRERRLKKVPMVAETPGRLDVKVVKRELELLRGFVRENPSGL